PHLDLHNGRLPQGSSAVAGPSGETAMTLLGKTLTFFVLLFSVITGGMMAMAFVTRTNWRTRYENAQNEVNVLIAAQKAEREHFKALREKYEKDLADAKTAIDTANTKITGLEANLKNQEQKVADLVKNANTEAVNNQAATRQIDALSQERNQLKDQLTASNNQVLRLQKDFLTASNNETQATILAGKLRDQVQSLMMQVEKMSSQLAYLKARGIEAPNGNLKSPSPEVQGTITGVEGSIATTSLGKDHGVNAGDELQVFRLTPQPIYLGKLRISIARDHDSVGTFPPASPRMTITKGDTVDTKVLHGGK